MFGTSARGSASIAFLLTTNAFPPFPSLPDPIPSRSPIPRNDPNITQSKPTSKATLAPQERRSAQFNLPKTMVRQRTPSSDRNLSRGSLQMGCHVVKSTLRQWKVFGNCTGDLLLERLVFERASSRRYSPLRRPGDRGGTCKLTSESCIKGNELHQNPQELGESA